MQKKSIPAMKRDDWPRQDRELWLQALSPARFLEDAGPASAWSSATKSDAERGYGIYLSWLESSGALSHGILPVDRVSKELIKAFIEDYSPGRSENTVAGVIRGIAYLFRAIAPPDGISWLTKLAHRLSNRAVRSRPKLPRMASVQELLGLAGRLMSAGQDLLAEGVSTGAVHYRDGLMIACLVARPLRRRNLTALRLGVSFLPQGDGYRAFFPRHETKKGVEIDFLYPAWFNEKFAIYLRKIRPILLCGSEEMDEGWLWIGRYGRRMSENTVSTRIGNVTMKHLGRRVSPHLFRDIGATSIALHDPGHVGITKTVLGHDRLSSSQQFYNQAHSFSAVRSHGDLMAWLRKDEDR